MCRGFIYYRNNLCLTCGATEVQGNLWGLMRLNISEVLLIPSNILAQRLKQSLRVLWSKYHSRLNLRLRNTWHHLNKIQNELSWAVIDCD